MNDLDRYQDWRVEVTARNGHGKKVLQFINMTRGQVIIQLQQQGHVKWRFLEKDGSVLDD